MGALHRVIEGTGPRVVLVHGFTQTGRSWAPVAEHLVTGGHQVVRIDVPGHGGSADVDADLPGGAALMADAGGRAVWVGYSMGGRLALRLALDRPDLVRGLVLLGATAGIDDPAERARRRAADEDLADDLERDGLDAFLERWLAQPLFAGLPDDPADRADRARNRADALAASLRRAGTGTMDPPWWAELDRITAPTLVLAGERDAKFTVLGRRLVAGIGADAAFRSVPAAGHAAHLEAPGAVADLLTGFLTDLAS